MNNKFIKGNILVTGGAGFIGSHLVDHLLEEGYAVKVIDNLSNGSLENLKTAILYPDFTFIEGDILDRHLCSKVIQGIDYVFHLACLGVRHSIHSPFENHRVNAEGTLRILESAKSEGVKHFFYISTSEIYGRTKYFPINEDALPKPLTVYGASKLAGEQYTNAYLECYNMPSTIVRIFNNYGPRAHFEGDAGEIIPRSIVKILYGQQPIIFGKGNITRDFFFVKDTANVLLEFLKIAATNPEKINGQTYNIGTGKEITMKELLHTILVQMNSEMVGIKYMQDRPADVPRLWVDAHKYKMLTGYKSGYTLEDGLKETIRYYKEMMTEKDMLNEIKITNWVKI